MIKRFLAWLKSIYFKPATAETQAPGVTMSEPLVDEVAAPGTIADMEREAARLIRRLITTKVTFIK